MMQKDCLILTSIEMAKQFTYADIVVAAWRKFPDVFSLKGHDLPDSNKVYVAMLTGPLRYGHFVKVREKTYARTAKAQQRADELLGTVTPAPEPSELSPDLEAFVRTARQSRAYALYVDGKQRELTFAAAADLWGGERLSGSFTERIKELERATAEADCRMSGGEVLTSEGIRFLANLQDYLLDRFNRHIKLLEARRA
jgi:hypothetical protein